MKTASRIKKLRMNYKMTQAELAKASRLTPAAICQIEKNKRTPSLSSLIRLAQVFGVDLDFIAGVDDCWIVQGSPQQTKKTIHILESARAAQEFLEDVYSEDTSGGFILWRKSGEIHFQWFGRDDDLRDLDVIAMLEYAKSRVLKHMDEE